MRKDVSSASSFSLGFGNGCIEGSVLSEGINASAVAVLEVAGATDEGIEGGVSHCVDGGTGPKLSLPTVSSVFCCGY